LRGILAQPAQYFFAFQPLPRVRQTVAAAAYPLQRHTMFRNISQRVEHAGARHAKPSRQHLAGMKFAVREDIQQLPGSRLDRFFYRRILQGAPTTSHSPLPASHIVHLQCYAELSGALQQQIFIGNDDERKNRRRNR